MTEDGPLFNNDMRTTPGADLTRYTMVSHY